MSAKPIRFGLKIRKTLNRRANKTGGSAMVLAVGTLVSLASAVGAEPEPSPESHGSASNWYASDPLARELSQLTASEYARFRDSELLDMQPVVLPRKSLVEAGNDYFDWPVACRVEDTIVVLYDRRRFHWGGVGSRMNEQSGIRMIVVSSDGGRTWSDPVDVIEQAGTWSKTLFDGWGGGIGTHDGVVYLALNEGVYQSKDKGRTWSLVVETPNFEHVAFEPTKVRGYGPGSTRSGGTARAAAPFWSPGMRLTFDEQHGLTIWTTRGFKAEGRDGKTNTDYGRYLSAVYSPDFGSTWRYEEQSLPESLYLNEITPLQFDDGKLAFFLRNGIRGSQYGQGYSQKGWFPFDFAVTSVGPVDVTDTPDLIYNPRTGRLEAAATFRHRNRPMDLRLFSIDPAELAAGKSRWRFDGVLVRYRNRFGQSDGMNPVGGVIDREAGVHRIYIWAGLPRQRAGIYQLTRSLHTPELSRFLLNRN